MGEKLFSKGMEVEICSDDKGLRGALFVGTVFRSTSKGNKVLVEYHTLMADEKGSKPLREFVDVINLRPTPPREIHRSFNVSDEVDAFHNDGWWEGVVIKVVENSRYLVYFRSGKEELEFAQSDLRIHREWVRGSWVPPMEDKADRPQEQDAETEHNQVDTRRTGSTHLSHVCNTADILSESNTRKQTMAVHSPTCNTHTLSPRRKLKNGEAAVDSLFLITHAKKEMPTSTPSTSEGLSYHPAPSFGRVKNGNVLKSAGSGSHPTIYDFSLSSHPDIAGDQCGSSKTQVESSGNNFVQSSGHRIKIQRNTQISSPCKKLKRGEATDNYMFLTTQPNIELPTTTTNPSGTLEQLRGHPAMSYGPKKIGNGSEPMIDDFSLSHSEREQCGLFEIQGECSENNLPQSSPHTIKMPGTGNTRISSPSTKLKKGEARDGSLVLITHSRKRNAHQYNHPKSRKKKYQVLRGHPAPRQT